MINKKGESGLWTREAILQVENTILQQIMDARTPEATEAAVSYATFLRKKGISSENYPLFLKMLTIENHWVLDELIGPTDPFELMSSIPPNEYLVAKCFMLLTRWSVGGIYPKTLAIVLGVLQNTYKSPRDGYRTYPLSNADLDNLGKHLDKQKGQNHSQNRCILDILENIASLQGVRLDESMERVARQALKIKGCFLDNKKRMADCIPEPLLAKGDYLQNEIPPRELFVG